MKFIDRTEVVHLLGPPGTGKSHLGTALAVEAVKAGKSVAFATLADIARLVADDRVRERLASDSSVAEVLGVIRGARDA